MIGGVKRDVVAGQFEDPDDDLMPKRKRKIAAKKDDVKLAAVQPSPLPPPTAPPVTPLSSLPNPESAAPIAESQLPLVPMIPHPTMMQSMTPMSIMPFPMMPHLAHPAAAAAWQQQHQAFVMSHMFAMANMNPMMQHMQQQFLQRSNTMAIQPPHPMQTQQQSHTHQHLAPQPSIQTAPDLEMEAEWRIPYSHNFHPKTGFVQDPTSSDPGAETTATCRPTNGRTSSKATLVMMAPLDESFLKEYDFPLIKEDTEKQFGLKISEITSKDVLCGRGGVTNSHEGNVHFRDLADQYRWHYATVKKSKKGDIARFLVQKIRDQYGRFLKKEDDDSWYEIGDELALAKAAQTLREGLAKIYRDGLKAKVESDHAHRLSTTTLPTNAKVASPVEYEGKSST